MGIELSSVHTISYANIPSVSGKPNPSCMDDLKHGLAWSGVGACGSCALEQRGR